MGIEELSIMASEINYISTLSKQHWCPFKREREREREGEKEEERERERQTVRLKLAIATMRSPTRAAKINGYSSF